jgi:hypothetical protein
MKCPDRLGEPTTPTLTSNVTLQENIVHFSVVVYSLVPRNITVLDSSVPQLTKISQTDEHTWQGIRGAPKNWRRYLDNRWIKKFRPTVLFLPLSLSLPSRCTITFLVRKLACVPPPPPPLTTESARVGHYPRAPNLASAPPQPATESAQCQPIALAGKVTFLFF